MDTRRYEGRINFLTPQSSSQELYDALMFTIEDIGKENTKTLKVLEVIEWVEHDPDTQPVYYSCPVCGGHRDKSTFYHTSGGHEPDCILAERILRFKGKSDAD